MSGSVELNYQKRKNNELFQQFEEKLAVVNCQNYLPIYDKMFSLNASNWNSINLNNVRAITRLTSPDTCQLINIKTLEEPEEAIFIKISPVLDSFKYIVGKYDVNDPHLFNLPKHASTELVHSELLDANNASYVDAFFYYLTAQLLHTHKFVHGVDFYGSFLGVQNNFKLNVIDDIDYLIRSDFFVKQSNRLFQVDDYSHFMPQQIKLTPIHISDQNCSLHSIEDIECAFNKPTSPTLNEVTLTLNDASIRQTSANSSTKSSYSSCSSKTTLAEEEREEEEEDSASYETTLSDDPLFLTIPRFPVQLICLEKCKNTLDHLILANQLTTSDEWISALFQIVVILLCYQKLFSFTHNDLHTNNVMFVATHEKYIYYTYESNHYRVPTYGRIFKIIDFGRAIYTFNKRLFCSNSFKPGGDAASQYNTEPYMDEQKPRLDPNFSFEIGRAHV